MSHANSERLLLLYDTAAEQQDRSEQTSAKASMSSAIGKLGYKTVLPLKFDDIAGLDVALSKISNANFSHAVILMFGTSSTDLLQALQNPNPSLYEVKTPTRESSSDSLSRLTQKLSEIKNVVQFYGPSLPQDSLNSQFSNAICVNAKDWFANDYETDFLVMLQLTFGPTRYSTTADPSKLAERFWENTQTGISEQVKSFLYSSLKTAIIDEIGTSPTTHEALGTLADGVFKNDTVYFQSGARKCHYIYNLLRAMTMARRLCSYTLEGEKFNLWIELNFNDISTSSGTSSGQDQLLFQFASNIEFSISNEKSVREIAELAIGDKIKLVVDSRTNAITAVQLFNNSTKNNSSLFLHVFCPS